MFLVIVIIVIGLVVYFHVLQGLFSATISAMLAVIAAVVAVGWHESLVNSLLGGKMADSAHAIALVALFAGTYLILRILFDWTVPGNMRFHAIVDKVGGGVMGAIAGGCAAGVIAIAAQTMPLSPSVAGYARHEIEFNRQVVVPAQPGASQSRDRTFDALRTPKELINGENTNHLVIPVDDLVLSLVEKLSAEKGSLSNSEPFTDVHPDYLRELFAQRLGMEPGAKHTLLKNQLRVDKIFWGSPSEVHDAEEGGVRDAKLNSSQAIKPADREKLKKANLFIVRVHVDINATDNDHLFRVGPANVRLVMDGKDFFPIGTMFQGDILYVNYPDDLLIAEGDKNIDFAFEMKGELKPMAAGKVKEGVFIEVKRLAREDLSGKPTELIKKDKTDMAVMRKRGPAIEVASSEPTPPNPNPNPNPNPENPPADAVPVTKGMVIPNGDLRVPIMVNSDAAQEAVIPEGGSWTANQKNFMFTFLMMPDPVPLDELAKGKNQIKSFKAPQGKGLVQVVVIPNDKKPWDWADHLGDFELEMADGNKSKVNGAFVLFDPSKKQLLGKYDPDNDPIRRMDHPNITAKPIEVWLLFVTPPIGAVKDLNYQGKPLK